MIFSNKIKVAIVDDHSLFRKGMVSILSFNDDIEVVTDSGNGQIFLDYLQENNVVVDVVLLDLQMPVLDGIKTTQILKRDFPNIKIIILSMHDEDQFVLHLIELGVNAYLLKDTDPDEVMDAIHSVMESGFYHSDLVFKAMHRKMNKKDFQVNKIFNYNQDLSEREISILKHICQGLTTDEISEAVSLSPRTIEGHRIRMMEKLGVKNTSGLVAFAIRNNLV